MMDRSSQPKNPCRKEYVPVRVDFSEDGIMFPRSIIWIDGEEYPIDRVKDIRRAPALKADGQGDRYTVEIGGRNRFLYFEHNPDYGNEQVGRWFMEILDPSC